MSEGVAYDVQRACRGKNRYSDEDEANRVAAVAYRERGHWLRVYRCDDCCGYHVTHQRALPPEGKNWRPPAMSGRAMARERNRDRHRRRK